MISLALVCPPKEPHWALLGTGYSLVQAAWCLESQEYREFYKKSPDYRILDYQHIGATAPDKAVSMAAFLEVAAFLKPEEVVAPDVLDDAKETILNLKAFLEKDLPGNPRILFVPQGNTLEAWYNCFREGHEILRNVEIDFAIGICKKSQALDPWHRSYPVRLVQRHTSQSVHILGARSVREFAEMAHLSVRSWDTSLPLAAAQVGPLLEKAPLDWKPQLDLELPVNAGYVLRNVNFIRKLLGGDPPFPS